MGGGGKRGWKGGHAQLDALHHPLATLLSPLRLLRATPSSSSHPPVPAPAPRRSVLSLQDATWLKGGRGHLSRDDGLQSRLAWWDYTLYYQGIKTRPPALFAVFSRGFPLPPLLLIVKMRSLIGEWVKSPVISAGNHPLIERYHKNLPRAWFSPCLLGAPFVPWQSPPMGTQLTLLFSLAEIRRVVLGDTHPRAWPKYRFKRVSSVRRNSWRMLRGVFAFHCTINAPDLIEDDAHTHCFPYMRVRSGSFEGVIVKLACKLGQ